ncbi:MAG: amino acid decarboxylase [Oscillospiraceae bacterium]|nr:amino acid decarboxylase [Oscillospiraceae bacterium]
MTTPIADFVRARAASGTSRLHMPGHKGRPFLGCEALDITEIAGADSLYEANGIIRASEENASKLFGSARTFFSAEGSSQCIRAMLALAVWNAPQGRRPVIAAARNVHKSFLYAAALLDFDVVWIWPEKSQSVCACPVRPETLERVLADNRIDAVYITSPDYLGGMCDIQALSETAHRFGVPLLADNAHGAYLRFLTPSRHPMDLGADLCCDSAHKTLPVLTGGAYLHINSCAPSAFAEEGKRALALFGSTSPSYLILQSLDLCNRYLSENYPERLAESCDRLERLREHLRSSGWSVPETDPLKLTIDCAASGWDGRALAQKLRSAGMECEYCSQDDLVLMWTPENAPEDFRRLVSGLGENSHTPLTRPPLPAVRLETVCSIREAMFAPREVIPVREAAGRICGAPLVGCPPAVPIVAAGERIGPETAELFVRYGAELVEVLLDN